MQRALVGTWVTDELKKAVAVGYRVLQTYEVWHYYDVSQYNPESGSGGCLLRISILLLKSSKSPVTGQPGVPMMRKSRLT